MRIALIALNALAILAGAVIFILGVIYDPRQSWGIQDALKLFAFLIPFGAALWGLLERSSSLTKSIATWLCAAWAILLTILGLGAATGIGGAVGLLIFILPALLLLLLNWRALRKRSNVRVDA